jgi:hypothetical protein
MFKDFFSMQNKAMLKRVSRLRSFLLFAISMLVIPGLLQAAGQRHNPWSFPDNSGLPAGNRPWGNIPPGQDYRQSNRQNNGWREPPVNQEYYRPGYPYQGYSGTPYQGYMGSPYTDPYSGYGSPYNPSLLPGYGGMHGIYPGLEGGSTAPGTMFPYPGW